MVAILNKKLNGKDDNSRVTREQLFLIASVVGPEVLQRVADKYQIVINPYLTWRKMQLLLTGVVTQFTPEDNLAAPANKAILALLSTFPKKFGNALAVGRVAYAKLAQFEKKRKIAFEKDIDFWVKQQAIEKDFPTPKK